MKYGIKGLSGSLLFEAEIDGEADSSKRLKLALEMAVKTDADLGGAYLGDAYLGGALGIVPELCTPLLMLLDQPSKIRAYKLVNSDGEGPFNGGLRYER